MAENKQQTEDDTIPYMIKLEELTCIHPEIRESIITLIKILKMRKTSLKQTLMNLGHHSNIIDEELRDEDFGIVYSNIDLLTIHLPNLRREQINWNTLQQEEIGLLADFIVEIIEKANQIKEKVIKEPIKQKEDMMDEQEKTAFEQVVRKELASLNDRETKIDYSNSLKKIRDRLSTKEKEILANNICLEFYGKKLEEMEWKIGKRKKADAKSAMQ